MITLLNIILLLANLWGLYDIQKQYLYILEYKRDERIFDEYKKKGSDVLNDYVASDEFDF